jgi:hypothetical protein
MEGKLTFWHISDDVTAHYLDRSLRRPKFEKGLMEHVLKHLEYKIVGTSLVSCMNLQGSPDIFVIDRGCMSNNNPGDNHYSLLKKFAQAHSSALFCIVSMFKSHMEDGFNELNDYVKDEIVVEMWGNGNESLADYMYKKVLQYYPYKGAK